MSREREVINTDEIKTLKEAKGIIRSLECDVADFWQRMRDAKEGLERNEKAFDRLKDAVKETARLHDLGTHHQEEYYGGLRDGQEKNPFSILITIAKEITELRTENEIFADFKDAILRRSEIKITPVEDKKENAS